MTYIGFSDPQSYFNVGAGDIGGCGVVSNVLAFTPELCILKIKWIFG